MTPAPRASRAARTRGRWAAIVGLVLACLGTVLAATGVTGDPRDALTVDRARFAFRHAEPSAAPAEVALPHLWAREDGLGRLVTVGLYRVTLPPSTPDRPLWIYVPKLRTNAAFELNGQWVGDGGRLDPPVTRHANSPFWLPLPPALARPDHNELTIRVVSPEGTRGGLSAFYIGPREVLEPRVVWRRLIQNTGVYVTSAVIAATSLYILMIWWRVRREDRSGLLPLALAGLVWAARNLNLVLLDFGTRSEAVHRAIEIATFTGHGLFLALFGMFLVARYEHLMRRGAGRLFRVSIWVFVALGPVLLFLLRGPAPALTIWLIASAPLLVAMMWILALRARSSRASVDILLAALFAAFIAASIYDNAVLMRTDLFGRIYVAHYAGLLFFGALAWMMVQQYALAIAAHRDLNLSLEARLAQRERELENRFNDAQALERERAALAERGRIMRDLHDGVGAQLLSAIHSVGEHGADAAAIRQSLTACLDDLRLAVDSLEPHNNYLTTILGGLRYRLAPRLARAGLVMHWDVEEVGPLDWLDPTRTLQLLRILQEAISNVLQHSRATTVRITVARAGGGVEVEIRDDGIGFDTTTSSGGHGLRNLRQRAAILGADLRLHSGPDGTTISLSLPG